MAEHILQPRLIYPELFVPVPPIISIINAIPIISQLKSLIQVCCGDARGAKQTQEQFIVGCPIVSQLHSLVLVCQGQSAAKAEFVQLQSVNLLRSVVDSTPLVGHLAGMVYYATGDEERGDNSMKSATRPLVVVAGGVAGLVLSGPAGAGVGGVLAGTAFDGIVTGLDSAIHDEYHPAGIIALGDNIKQCIDNNKCVSGAIFDLTALVIMDAVMGYEAGQWMKSKMMANNAKRLLIDDPDAHAIIDLKTSESPGHDFFVSQLDGPEITKNSFHVVQDGNKLPTILARKDDIRMGVELFWSRHSQELSEVGLPTREAALQFLKQALADNPAPPLSPSRIQNQYYLSSRWYSIPDHSNHVMFVAFSAKPSGVGAALFKECAIEVITMYPTKISSKRFVKAL